MRTTTARRTTLAAAALTAMATLIPAAAAQAAPREPYNLVSAGDSFTAGIGLTHDPADFNGCGRALDAYPDLVRQDLHGGGFDVACSGATTEAFATSYRGELPQADAIARGSRIGIKGVVFTIGGNDAKLLTALSNAHTAADVRAATAATYRVRQNIEKAIVSVRQAAPDAHVYVMTYLNPVPWATNAQLRACAGDVLPQGVGVATLQAAVLAINGTVAAATTHVAWHDPKVHLVIAPPSVGHDACSTSPWYFKPQDPTAAIHPNEAGQRVMANALERAIKRHQDALVS